MCACACVFKQAIIESRNTGWVGLHRVASLALPRGWRSWKGRAGSWSDEPRGFLASSSSLQSSAGGGGEQEVPPLPSEEEVERSEGGDRTRCFQRLVHGLPRFRHPASRTAAANGRGGQGESSLGDRNFCTRVLFLSPPPRRQPAKLAKQIAACLLRK